MLNSTLLWLQIFSQTALPDSNSVVLKDSLKEDIVVSSLKATQVTPVTQTNISKVEIQQRNVGFDLPYLIQYTPSIIARSDAGNFVGYTDMRMRGMTDSRISFSINGIPVNDAETQGFYTNNFADLASSAQSIQIQRGVGTTGNGTAPFAGSINLVTNDLNQKQSLDFNAGFGSFNTSRLMAQYNSGLMNDKFAFYGRISKVQSDGYRYNSGANLLTYFWSGGYFGKKSILKINVFGGVTQTQLAYYGLDNATLNQNRRTNFQSPFEKDEFRQNYFQLQYTYKISDKLNYSYSAYYVNGTSPYYQIYWPGMPYYYANMPNVNGNTATDMIPSYRLNQNFYGAMMFLKYTTERVTIDAGLHANSFQADHFMEINWARELPSSVSPYHRAYFNTGYKRDISAFLKANYYLSDKFLLFADVQVRSTSWRYKAQDQPIYRDTFNVEPMRWLFVNPRLGSRYFINGNLSLYASAGMVTREPTRTDYLTDDRAVFNVKQSDMNPERVFNIETGTNFNFNKVKGDINIYLMQFQNEIMQTGAINAYGASVKNNIEGGSHRRGIEFSLQYQIDKHVTLLNNSAFSHNKIYSYKQTFDIDSSGVNLGKKTIEFRNVNPLLSPNVVINQGVRIAPLSWINAEVWGRYVGKMYLENTNSAGSELSSYFLVDAKLNLNLSEFVKISNLNLSILCNNVTNTLYSPAGLSTATLSRDLNGNDKVTSTSSFFPAATRNFMISLNAKF